MKGVVLEIFFFRNGQTNGSTNLLFLQPYVPYSVMLSEPTKWIESFLWSLNVILHRFFGYFMVEIKKEGGCVLYVMCTMG